MSDQLLDHFGRVCRIVGDEVGRPLRHARVPQCFHDRGVGARALLGCLQHDRVAVRKRRRHSADAEHDRSVPGCDPDDHADRLAHRLRPLARDVRGNVLLFRRHVGLTRVVGEHPGAELHVEHAPTDRAVRLLGDQGRDRSLALHQQLRSALKPGAALARHRRRPLRKSRLGRLHCETSRATSRSVSHPRGAGARIDVPKLTSAHRPEPCIPCCQIANAPRPVSRPRTWRRRNRRFGPGRQDEARSGEAAEAHPRQA